MYSHCFLLKVWNTVLSLTELRMQNPVWSLSLRAWNTSPAGHLPAWDVGEGSYKMHQQHPGALQSQEPFLALPRRVSFSRFEVGWGQLVVLISSMGVSDLQPDLRIPELDALLGSFQS